MLRSRHSRVEPYESIYLLSLFFVFSLMADLFTRIKFLYYAQHGNGMHKENNIILSLLLR